MSKSERAEAGRESLAAPVAGEWVLFRDDRHDPISVSIKQAEKVTPSLVKFSGNWPRQCHILSVVASFPDKETAERVRDSIGGVAGEYIRRCRSAEDERAARVASALEKANRQVEAIVARAALATRKDTQ